MTMKSPKNENQENSRRSFIKNAAIASSIAFVPRHVLGGVGFTAPSDQTLKMLQLTVESEL